MTVHRTFRVTTVAQTVLDLASLLSPKHLARDQFLDLIRQANLPHPEVNAVVDGKRVDFLWRSERVIVETDGWAAHGRRSAFVNDRARDLDFEARGYRTARISEEQMRKRPLEALTRVAALVLAA